MEPVGHLGDRKALETGLLCYRIGENFSFLISKGGNDGTNSQT